MTTNGPKYYEYISPEPIDDALPDSSAYDRVTAELREYHTGATNGIVTSETQKKLSVRIQEGLAASTYLGANDAETNVSLTDTVKDGKKAECVLVESHLRVAAYLARLSMNLLPYKTTTMPKGKRGNVPWRYQAKHPWIPADFTALKSAYASLDDRTQAANEALVKAARSYNPDISFANWAAQCIKTGLSKYVRESSEEKPGPYVSAEMQREMRSLYIDEQRGVGYEATSVEVLRRYQAGEEPLPLESIQYVGGNDEESSPLFDAPNLTLAEVLADPNESVEGVVMKRMIHADLLNALGTLSEKDAKIVCMRYGLPYEDEPYGKEHTHVEIGRVLGISRSRVGQRLTASMTKLRRYYQGADADGLLSDSDYPRPYPIGRFFD